MANITATISLDNIVKELLWKAELPESKERLFFQLAIRAYQEMRLFDVEEGVARVLRALRGRARIPRQRFRLGP